MNCSNLQVVHIQCTYVRMYIYMHVNVVCVCIDYGSLLMYRLNGVKTTEELSDVYAQFSLYYGRDLVDMQHLKTMQKRQGDTEEQVE